MPLNIQYLYLTNVYLKKRNIILLDIKMNMSSSVYTYKLSKAFFLFPVLFTSCEVFVAKRMIHITAFEWRRRTVKHIQYTDI